MLAVVALSHLRERVKDACGVRGLHWEQAGADWAYLSEQTTQRAL